MDENTTIYDALPGLIKIMSGADGGCHQCAMTLFRDFSVHFDIPMDVIRSVYNVITPKNYWNRIEDYEWGEDED